MKVDLKMALVVLALLTTLLIIMASNGQLAQPERTHSAALPINGPMQL